MAECESAVSWQTLFMRSFGHLAERTSFMGSLGEYSVRSGESTVKHTLYSAMLTLLLINSHACCVSAADSEAPDSAQPVTSASFVVKQTAKTIAVSQGAATVLVYNKQSPVIPEGVDAVYQRTGFLHPVKSPAGHVVTGVFPTDHRHQNGIFSAWTKTSWNDRKIDFWNLGDRTGRVLHHRLVATFCEETSAGFEVALLHRGVEQPVVDVLLERWKVTVRPTDRSFHCFDLETTQTALTDSPLTIGEYRYGGIALRGSERWLHPKKHKGGKDAGERSAESQAAFTFLNDRGSDRIQGNHEKARWVSLTGNLDGSPVSITVLCHADNFRAPQTARLYPSKPYFCFAPCVEGQFVIKKDHPYHAMYRYLVTDAAPDVDWLNQQWQDWCGP